MPAGRERGELPYWKERFQLRGVCSGYLSRNVVRPHGYVCLSVHDAAMLAPEVVVLDDDDDDEEPEHPQLAVLIQDQLHSRLGAVKAELNTEKEGHEDARDTVYAQLTLTDFERDKYDSLLKLCKQSSESGEPVSRQAWEDIDGRRFVQPQVEAPHVQVATPVATPVAAPVATPVATPVAAPVATPVATPARLGRSKRSRDTKQEQPVSGETRMLQGTGPPSQKKQLAMPMNRTPAGTRIQGRYGASTGVPMILTDWYDGRVEEVHSDGTLRVTYDDGDEEDRVLPRYVRVAPVAEQSAPAPARAPAVVPPAPTLAPGPAAASHLAAKKRGNQALPIHPRAPGGRLKHYKTAGQPLRKDAEKSVKAQLQKVRRAEGQNHLVTGSLAPGQSCGTRIAVRADEGDIGTWFLKLEPQEGPLGGGVFFAWIRFPSDFPDVAPHFAMLTPTCIFTPESTGVLGTASVCLEATYPHTTSSRARWSKMWRNEAIFGSSMVPWLITLAASIDMASTSPAELANVKRDGAEERATGTQSTMGMSVEDLTAACQKSVHDCGAHNAHRELAAVVQLFEED